MSSITKHFMSWWYFYTITLLGVVAINYAWEYRKEEDKKLEQLLEGCEVIGDALDGQKSGACLRKIYKCPDGMIRIR